MYTCQLLNMKKEHIPIDMMVLNSISNVCVVDINNCDPRANDCDEPILLTDFP